MISTLLYFLLTLLLLITVHEYGHFLVARLCGVKVVRFSFGFGKVLARWHDKQGTEYAWSLIPLGGYVKMLDEMEEKVEVSERHLAFNNKSVWARIAIIIAGPLFNFIFAFVAFWLVLVIGTQSLAPIIKKVDVGSISASAGFESDQIIVAVNNKPIVNWRDFQFTLMPLLGSNKTVEISVQSLSSKKRKIVILPLSHWKLSSEKKPDLLKSLGIVPFLPKIPPLIGEVLNSTPAQVAGLEKGDLIKQMDGQSVKDWLQLVDYVKQRPRQSLSLVIKRGDQLKTVNLLIGSKFNERKKLEGFLGVKSEQVNWPPHWLRLQRESPLQAIKTSFLQTVGLSAATFSLVGRLVTGKFALQNMSGPLGIAQGAGESARSGFTYYLSFLALVSISLGVLNLLPIPMLDGGQLLYCLIELFRGRPLSLKVKLVGMYAGLCILVALMFLALGNDLSRLVE